MRFPNPDWQIANGDWNGQRGLEEAEEADESLFWLEMVVETNLMPAARVRDLIQEADEPTTIFVASRKTAKKRK